MICSTLRCKHARTMAAQAPKRASFMGGSFRSPAADARARGRDPTCPFFVQIEGTIDHELWHYPTIPGVRPWPKPQDPLQARLGRPSGR